MTRSALFLLTAAAAVLFAPIAAAAAEGADGDLVVTVDASREVTPIPRMLFGTNYHPKMESDVKIRRLIRESGITMLRFPGGFGGYDWKRRMIARRERGNVVFKERREPFYRDFEAFVRFAKDLDCKIFMELNVGTGRASDAAELVRWNASHGRPIVYWGLGNEPQGMPDGAGDYGGYQSARDYVEDVRAYAKAIRRADPSAKLGACTWGWKDAWLGVVAREAAGCFDFIDCHWYPCRPSPASKRLTHQQVGMFTAANSHGIAERAGVIRGKLAGIMGARAKRVETVIGEFDASGFGQWQNSSLANALFYADAYGRMAELGVAAACHYSLQSASFGLVPGWRVEAGWGGNPWNGVTVRPKAYALRLWSRHMGSRLVSCRVTGSGSYDVSGWTSAGWHRMNYRGKAPHVTAWAGMAADSRTLSVMLINRHAERSRTARVTLAGFSPARAARRFLLGGPSYLASNDRGLPGQKPGPGFKLYQSHNPPPPVRVKLAESDFRAEGGDFAVELPPHSVTLVKMSAR